MKRDFYYYEKRSPLKGVIIVVIAAAVLGGGYWYYVNYFRTAGTEPMAERAGEDRGQSGIRVETAQGAAYLVTNDEQRQLASGDAVASGSRITTASGSRLALIVDEARVRLDGGSSAVISSDVIEVQGGRVYLASAPGGTMRIAVRATVITLIDGVADLLIDTDAATFMLTAVRGRARIFVSEDYTTAVREGERVTVTPDAPSSSVFTYSTLDRARFDIDPWIVWNAGVAQGSAQELQQPSLAIVTISPDVRLTAVRAENGVTLSWDAYRGGDLREYQLLRTAGDAQPTFKDTSALKTSTLLSFTSFSDTGAATNTAYRYALCIVRASGGALCSPTATVAAEPEKPADVLPTAPVITALISDLGTSFSWQVSPDADFKEYRLVRSVTSAVPSYPADGFIATFGNAITQYTDATVHQSVAGTFYYRLCAIDAANQVNCSNTITVKDGTIK